MKTRNRYSNEFKEQAVKRTLSGSFTIKEVSESLGINYYVLRGWRKEYMEQIGKDHNLETDKKIKESEELRKLRKENQKLKEENLILKKFAAILSKDQNPDSN